MDRNGMTPHPGAVSAFSVASKNGELSETLVKVLLERGVDVAATDSQGRTAFNFASESNVTLALDRTVSRWDRVQRRVDLSRYQAIASCASHYVTTL